VTISQSISNLLVALNCCRVISRQTICKLGSSVEHWVGDRKTLLGCCHRLAVSATETLTVANWLIGADLVARDQRRRVRDKGARLITRLDSAYPSALLDLELPPPVLYCRGSIPTRPAIAIVGSRRASRPNLETARMFGRELASLGITVVSGFARGIDQAAHRGALAAHRGTTVAILGCGIDVDYPSRSHLLADEIAQAGAVISEFPLGTAPLKPNFPIRNRLIASMSIGTLVVQATVRSGSLITARLAMELGRDVYGIPGPIFEPTSAGPNSLIRDGALLVQHPRDIIESLPIAAQDRLTQTEQAPAPSDIEESDNRLLSKIPRGQLISVERLAVETGLATDQILRELLELELEGLVRRCPGPTYCRSL
jgi:DNA processing protein